MWRVTSFWLSAEKKVMEVALPFSPISHPWMHPFEHRSDKV